MVKQQIKQSSKQKNINVTKPWLVIGITSLTLNAILVILSIVGAAVYSSGNLDNAVVNKGIDTLCSDKFRNMLSTDQTSKDISTDEQKTRLAFLDYECSRNGAGTYFEQGYKNYAHSLGLKIEQ